MGQAILSVWFIIAVLCLCSFCGLVAEWFRKQTNMGPLGSVMRTVLCLCSFRGLVATQPLRFRQQPNLRPSVSRVNAVSVVCWLSGSGDKQIGDPPFNESSLVFI